jgi:2-phospho-L-lactate guanylyltransferase
LNAAIREARAVAVARGATAVLVLPIDLAAIDAPAINELLAVAATATVAPADPAGASRPRPVVVGVPDRHGRGTNALLVAPPMTIDPAFGEGSFAAHEAAATAAGAVFVRHGGPLTLDVDTGADLLVAEAAASVSPGRDVA